MTKNDPDRPDWAASDADLLEPLVGREALSAWKFCSDHLPSAVEIHLADEKHLAISWNVLNEHWIDSNRMHGMFPASERAGPLHLNTRESEVLRVVRTLLAHESAAVLCLQECSRQLVAAVRETLPSSHDVVSTAPSSSEDQEITIFNLSTLQLSQSRRRRRRDVRSMMFRLGVVPHTLLDVTLYMDEKQPLRIVNVHVPIPRRPGAKRPVTELIEHLGEYPVREDVVTLILGDMNQQPRELLSALRQAGLNQLHVPRGGYRTHISFGRNVIRDLDCPLVSQPHIPQAFSAHRVSDLGSILPEAQWIQAVVSPSSVPDE